MAVRHSECFLALFLGIAMALLLPSLSSTNAEGAITDKTVLGTVYDRNGDPIAGAQVTVEIWGGSWPDQDFFRTSESAVTDAEGYYEVTINSNYWDPHNTIKVTATCDSIQGNRSVEANGDQYQTVNVLVGLTIPEFSASLGLLAMIAGSVVPITGLLACRRRRSRIQRCQPETSE